MGKGKEGSDERLFFSFFLFVSPANVESTFGLLFVLLFSFSGVFLSNLFFSSILFVLPFIPPRYSLAFLVKDARTQRGYNEKKVRRHPFERRLLSHCVSLLQSSHLNSPHPPQFSTDMQCGSSTIHYWLSCESLHPFSTPPFFELTIHRLKRQRESWYKSKSRPIALFHARLALRLPGCIMYSGLTDWMIDRANLLFLYMLPDLTDSIEPLFSLLLPFLPSSPLPSFLFSRLFPSLLYSFSLLFPFPFTPLLIFPSLPIPFLFLFLLWAPQSSCTCPVPSTLSFSIYCSPHTSHLACHSLH